MELYGSCLIMRCPFMLGKTTRLGSHGDLKKMKNITNPRKKQ